MFRWFSSPSAVSLQAEAPSVLVRLADIVKIIDDKNVPGRAVQLSVGHAKIGGLAPMRFRQLSPCLRQP